MPKKEPGFDESLKELEKILEALENPDVGVDEALKLYETGVKLVRNCEKKLDNVKQKIKYIDEIGEGENE